MSWRIKRVDPYWLSNPLVYGGAVASAILGVYGAGAGSTAATLVGGLGFCTTIFLAARPALSAVFATVGLLGGAAAFLFSANPGMGLLMRLVWTGGFGLIYMTVMNVVLLGVSALYNAFTRAGFSGLSLSLES
ncbi:MAG: hypothetical protein HY923_07280 [Elusimicrobia bacterium]|nr:hypothetical protein [Elusimicrobiota bacterium]